MTSDEIIKLQKKIMLLILESDATPLEVLRCLRNTIYSISLTESISVKDFAEAHAEISKIYEQMNINENLKTR